MIDVRNMNELLKYKQSLEEQLGYNQTNNIKNRSLEKQIVKGEIYWTDLGQGLGSEQSNRRPCLVIQNNVGNTHSPTVIIGIITSQLEKAKLPTHIEIDGFGLPKKSVILLEQLRTVDKRRLKGYIGKVDDITIRKVDNALKISLDINEEASDIIDMPTFKGLNQLDKIKNNEIRSVIEIKLKNIEGYERVLFQTKNKESKFYDMCLDERKTWLSDLESYCKSNNLNYKDYYKTFDGEEEYLEYNIV